MTGAQAYREQKNDFDVTAFELGDFADACDSYGESDLALLARDAQAAVVSLVKRLEFHERRTARREQAEQATIVAVLRDGETIESFYEGTIQAEVERRARLRDDPPDA